MLVVGLTGGIGSGKSAVTQRLARRGAAVVDADVVAREVVEPETPGLAALRDAFGPEVLQPDGSLDRPGLARRVFGDDGARATLNGIVHPLIGARTLELRAAAEHRGVEVLVHDVPLLAENGLAPGYHLVVVVEAPLDERLSRLTSLRGMPVEDARARIASQSSDEQRRDVADAVLSNAGDLAELDSAVARLWSERLVPYAQGLQAGRPAPRGPLVLADHDPAWQPAGRRLVERLRSLCGAAAVAVEHVGSTAVPGLPARDVLDLQVEVAGWDAADDLAPVLAQGGFPGSAAPADGGPRPELDPDPAGYRRRLHRNADPGRAADVHLRVAGSTSARATVALRDLLRDDPAARHAYAEAERRLDAQPGDAPPGDRRRLSGQPDDGQRRDDVDPLAVAEAAHLVPLLVRALG